MYHTSGETVIHANTALAAETRKSEHTEEHRRRGAEHGEGTR